MCTAWGRHLPLNLHLFAPTVFFFRIAPAFFFLPSPTRAVEYDSRPERVSRDPSRPPTIHLLDVGSK